MEYNKNVYKIVSITDRDNNPKTEQCDKLEKLYSLYGTFYGGYEPHENGTLCFVYDGQDDVMLRSSTIEAVECNVDKTMYVITTRNTIYTLKISKNQ